MYIPQPVVIFVVSLVIGYGAADIFSTLFK
jgi:hypothetical protein